MKNGRYQFLFSFYGNKLAVVLKLIRWQDFIVSLRTSFVSMISKQERISIYVTLSLYSYQVSANWCNISTNCDWNSKKKVFKLRMWMCVCRRFKWLALEINSYWIKKNDKGFLNSMCPLSWIYSWHPTPF